MKCCCAAGYSAVENDANDKRDDAILKPEKILSSVVDFCRGEVCDEDTGEEAKKWCEKNQCPHSECPHWTSKSTPSRLTSKGRSQAPQQLPSQVMMVAPVLW